MAALLKQKSPMKPPVVWDFSKGHSANLIAWPDDAPVEDPKVLFQVLNESRMLQIKLPCGKMLEAPVENILARRSNDRIKSLRCRCPMATLDESVERARELLGQLDLDASKVNDWYQKVSSSGAFGPGFEQSRFGPDYSFTVAIRFSYDEKLPWIVTFQLYFDLDQEEF